MHDATTTRVAEALACRCWPRTGFGRYGLSAHSLRGADARRRSRPSGHGSRHSLAETALWSPLRGRRRFASRVRSNLRVGQHCVMSRADTQRSFGSCGHPAGALPLFGATASPLRGWAPTDHPSGRFTGRLHRALLREDLAGPPRGQRVGIRWIDSGRKPKGASSRRRWQHRSLATDSVAAQHPEVE